MADVPRVKLGTQDLELSKLGFGCMGLTGMYNDPAPEKIGISIIKYAFTKGITFFDTADFYGAHANEVLVGKIGTKYGIGKMESNTVIVNGTPQYGRSFCEGSLQHLGMDYIDLYYQHRVDTTVPIEETLSAPKLCTCLLDL